MELIDSTNKSCYIKHILLYHKFILKILITILQCNWTLGLYCVYLKYYSEEGFIWNYWKLCVNVNEISWGEEDKDAIRLFFFVLLHIFCFPPCAWITFQIIKEVFYKISMRSPNTPCSLESARPGLAPQLCPSPAEQPLCWVGPLQPLFLHLGNGATPAYPPSLFSWGVGSRACHPSYPGCRSGLVIHDSTQQWKFLLGKQNKTWTRTLTQTFTVTSCGLSTLALS